MQHFVGFAPAAEASGRIIRNIAALKIGHIIILVRLRLATMVPNERPMEGSPWRVAAKPPTMTQAISASQGAEVVG